MNATTATATATGRPTVIRWDRRRDGYGRTIHVAITAEGGEYGEQSLVGVVVSMPKAYRQSNPDQNYMVNLQDPANPGRVHHFKTLRVAKAFLAVTADTRAERAAR